MPKTQAETRSGPLWQGSVSFGLSVFLLGMGAGMAHDRDRAWDRARSHEPARTALGNQLGGACLKALPHGFGIHLYTPSGINKAIKQHQPGACAKARATDTVVNEAARYYSYLQTAHDKSISDTTWEIGALGASLVLAVGGAMQIRNSGVMSKGPKS